MIDSNLHCQLDGVQNNLGDTPQGEPVKVFPETYKERPTQNVGSTILKSGVPG